jgi:hypothetical protein
MANSSTVTSVLAADRSWSLVVGFEPPANPPEIVAADIIGKAILQAGWASRADPNLPLDDLRNLYATEASPGDERVHASAML